MFFLLSLAPISAQIKCSTQVPQGYNTTFNKYQSNQTNSSTSNTLLPHDTCLNKTLSIVFYVILDSMGNPGVTSANIAACIANLNKYWKPICVKFQSCSTVYVPNFNYNKWRQPAHEAQMVSNYFTPKTINIYLVDSTIVPPACYAYFPGGTDLIVLTKGSLGTLVPVHEMGHFFGLYHTFFNMGSGTEYVKRTNCYTEGDGFCDTEADPYPTGKDVTYPCDFKYGPKDPNNDYYTPPVDNIMSYWSCPCRFTQEQYNHMAFKFEQIRFYLH